MPRAPDNRRRNRSSRFELSDEGPHEARKHSTAEALFNKKLLWFRDSANRPSQAYMPRSLVTVATRLIATM